MPETLTPRAHLIALADLLDEPQHLVGPDAEACSAADHAVEWTELSLGWSRVLGAARVIQKRHADDSEDVVLSQCAYAAREAAVGELRWVWARLVNKFIGEVGSDV
ncbi:Uncharacterised protein [Mycobacteroides abscessus subsp. abscessus]|uniref:hypothetical protein n=1 Tax=Mycobacteroides abscessus TaxID=36809 RepID=UPI0009D43B90|nr:hypothetical protein [Mycobacteroides abscessus]MDO3046312.1 hypothetical protein [Mycobacteroides abscessus subsp. abscessus]MDO3137462.1 hypothetical protein [Mycobacteroides abscessus subsp. abscessus]MDO3154938.1 hypothetical protein [Mycobacteroides abscessus subsp. abscessus]SKR47731.1 Uncharacterised protein [Mycobacteroides abscessus subsp. abscessus]SKX59923.1 Uncharacterised protein [Mycobacteroides abscessus subsp. abscessus]